MNLKAVIITICLLGCLFSGISTGQESRTWEKLKPRTWTAANGKSNEGTLIGVEGNQVSLSINGKAIPIKLEKLSPADQAYIENAKKFMFDELLGFDQVTVSSVNAEGISITHVGGIARIPIQDIPVELRKQFGMDSLVIEQKKKQAEEREKSWKYGNLEWGSTSEAITELLKEKGFQTAKTLKEWISNSGEFSYKYIQFSGGTVLDHKADIVCRFANDELHEVVILQTEYDAVVATKIEQVLQEKYGEGSEMRVEPALRKFLGDRRRSWKSEPRSGNKNKTEIWHGTDPLFYGTKVKVTNYSYPSGTKDLVSEALEKEKKENLKERAKNSDL